MSLELALSLLAIGIVGYFTLDWLLYRYRASRCTLNGCSSRRIGDLPWCEFHEMVYRRSVESEVESGTGKEE